MLKKTKKVMRPVIKWGFRIYIIIATLAGTIVMAWPFIVLGYNGLMAPAPMPVYLPNGFIYDRDSERKYAAPNAIYDKLGTRKIEKEW